MKEKPINNRSHHNNQSNNGKTEFLEQKHAHYYRQMKKSILIN